MFKRAITSLLALPILISLLASTTVGAATSTSGNGILLSPVRYDLTIDPGKSQTIKFNVQNVTNSKSTYQVTIAGFTAANDTGAPQIIVNPKQYNPYGISQFISPIPDVTIAPHATSTVDITINIPSNTPGGGYYGAARFLVVNQGSSQSVNLASSIAGLILITVPGPKMNQDLKLTQFNVSQNGQSSGLFYSSGGIDANAYFANAGNVQIEPFGKIQVKNMQGNVIETKTINNSNPPGNVLPGTTRLFSAHLTGLGPVGKYTVQGFFGYGSKGQLLSASATFYVIAPWIIILAIVLIVLIIVAIFFMPKIFRLWYKRSIRKAQR